MPVFETIWRRLYAAIATLSWGVLGASFLAHAALSWVLLRLAGETELITGAATFAYFYVTTATTVGYGDLSPSGTGGRVAALLFVIPGSIALFTGVLGKAIADVASYWRRRMHGLGQFRDRTGHTLVVGWQGARTRRLVDMLIVDQPSNDRIILLARALEENPMPGQVDFVRAESLSSLHSLERAGAKGARSVVVRGNDDDDTLAATLAARSAAPRAHIVAHFEDDRTAELISRQCAGVEAVISLASELLVRASRDPGASRIADLMFSAHSEDTAYSMPLPAGIGPISYLDALVGLKRQHAITLIGIGARDGGQVDLNCEADRILSGGEILFYIADKRVDTRAVAWESIARGNDAAPRG